MSEPKAFEEAIWQVTVHRRKELSQEEANVLQSVSGACRINKDAIFQRAPQYVPILRRINAEIPPHWRWGAGEIWPLFRSTQ